MRIKVFTFTTELSWEATCDSEKGVVFMNLLEYITLYLRMKCLLSYFIILEVQEV